MHCLYHWFSIKGNPAPRDTCVMSGNICGCHNGVGGAPAIKWVRPGMLLTPPHSAQDTTSMSAMLRRGDLAYMNSRRHTPIIY